MFRVFTTEEFEKEFNKLDKTEQLRISKILNQLKEKGGDVGKPLAGLSFFREKKYNGKRLYFLFYRDFLVVLVIAVSDKKAQQATINDILLHLVEYQQYVSDLLKNKGLL